MAKRIEKQSHTAPSPRRAAARALGASLFAALLAAVPVINYFGDASGLYISPRDSSSPTAIAEALLEGSNLEGVGNYNERLVRRIVVNSMDRREVVVLGSSRAAMISADALGLDPEDMFNCGVAGGSLKDIIGFYGVLWQQQKLPDRVVIILDPWMLNDNYDLTETRWKQAVGDGYYNYLTGRMGLEADSSLLEIHPLADTDPSNDITGLGDLSPQLLQNLFSVTYFQSSLQLLSKQGFGRSWTETDQQYGELELLRSDGSFCYPLSYRDTTYQQKLSYASQSIGNIIGLEDYQNLDSENLLLLEQFLESVKQDGVEVQLVLFPISNLLYTEMEKDPEHYKGFFAAQGLMEQAAEKAGVKLVGNFNPFLLGFDLTAFYDGYHPGEIAVRTILKDLVS